MVYAGLINKQVVAGLHAEGCTAIGLSGADGNAIRASKRHVGSIDYGFVGDVEEVNASLFAQLIEAGVAPVCCAITHNAQGLLLNTNADTIANEVAVALARHYKVQLHYIFEKDGVLLDPQDETSVIQSVTPSSFEAGKANGSISAGMIPKLDNAFAALHRGVAQVVIGAPRLLRGEGAGPTVISL
jgi:acetylglutamate kinase